jgi:hypothetical protein
MATLLDCRHDALVAQFGSGHVSDLMIQWLQFNGATSPHITDAWDEVLTLLVGPGQHNDRWHEWLTANGYGAPDEHINDAETDFWCSGGLLVPKPPSTASFNSDFSGDFSQ